MRIAAAVAAHTGRDDIQVHAVHWRSDYAMNARLAERYRGAAYSSPLTHGSIPVKTRTTLAARRLTRKRSAASFVFAIGIGGWDYAAL